MTKLASLLFLGGTLVGCDLATGLDDFRVREDAAPDAPCAVVPADDFATGVDAERWDMFGTADVSSDGDDLVITAAPGQNGRIESRAVFDFTGCQAHVQLVRPPHVTGRASFRLALSNGMFAGFVTGNDGLLRMGVSNDPTLSTGTVTTPVAAGWWRMRHTGSSLVFEISDDRVKWEVKRQVTAPAVDEAILILGGGALPSAPAPVSIVFDNLNTDG